MRKKLFEGTLFLVAAVALTCAANAATVAFPSKTGDIASTGADGWNGTMPGVSDVAKFAIDGGAYTASKDVQFGGLMVQGLYDVAFNLHQSGNPTVKLSVLYIGYKQRSAVLNGGVWDFSIETSPSTSMDKRRFGACTKTPDCFLTALTLAKGCIVTNAIAMHVSNGGRSNKLRITDSSRVYVNGVQVTSGGTAVDCLLEVSSGAVLNLMSGNFLDTSDSLVPGDTTNRVVVTGIGSKILCPASLVSGDPRGFVIGNGFGRNSLLVEEGGELQAPFRFALGFGSNAHTNHAVFKTGAKFLIRDINVGENGSCGNVLEFLSGASGTIEVGGRVGGWKGAGSDNLIVVSNAVVDVTGVLGIGSPSVDASSISGNGLIVEGDSTEIDITSNLLVKNRSFLRFRIPKDGYREGLIPLKSKQVIFDATSSLDVTMETPRVKSGIYTLVSTQDGIEVSESAVAAANASLAEQSGGKASLLLSEDGKKLYFVKMVNGTVISLR